MTFSSGEFEGQTGLAFDIGAHTGEDSAYMLARGWKVVAFECNPENFNGLMNRFKNYHLQNFRVETRAISEHLNHDREVEFYLDEKSVWGTVNPDWASRNVELGSSQRKIRIAGVKPSDIFLKYGFPEYMKIDIEGSDFEVLISLSQIPPTFRPKYLSIELSTSSWLSMMRDYSLLSWLGYTGFQIIGQQSNSKKITRWADDSGSHFWQHERDSSGPIGPDLPSRSWKSLRTTPLKISTIYFMDRFFGVDGIFGPKRVKNMKIRKSYIRVLSKFGLLNWYDIHASR